MGASTLAATSAEIRQQFIDFFVQRHGHVFVPSSPVVPHDDPTLLFTNAGMNQFKPFFLGTAKAPWKRAANTQKCIRAGGKHNDLDDVGRSRRHHTFFEMLGNWSFGDYFKQGAIEMAWELLTKVWGLDPTRLHVSCYEGNEAAGIPRDTEAAEIWKRVANWEQYGLRSEDFIHYFGKDNFWEMGETGPCGPCTEIYVDRTPGKTGGPEVNGNDPRVMEIWNLVFIQYNRDGSGKLTPLPAQHVDTGMGLERICQVLQGKEDNYATDLFSPIFDAISKISNLKYTGQFPPTNAADPALEAANSQLRIDIAFRVIADHARMAMFAITDGAMPGPNKRDAVLRAVIRRAVAFGYMHLSLFPPFLHGICPIIAQTMGDTFPELRRELQRVMAVIKKEEEDFGRTIVDGMKIFATFVINAAARQVSKERNLIFKGISSADYAKLDTGEMKAQKMVLSFEDTSGLSISESLTGTDEERMQQVLCMCKSRPIFSGKDAFFLHDTSGFPISLTRIMLSAHGISIDESEFDHEMAIARERSRGVDKAVGNAVYDLPPNVLDELAKLNVHGTDDSGKFKRGQGRGTVRAIWNGTDLDQSVEVEGMKAGEQVAVILDKTNFYAEMGGQVGDSGEMRTDGGAIFIVETTRLVGPYVLHLGHVKHGRLEVGESVTTSVMGGRERTEKNHTSTHLANWALRETLGEHVQQKGSLVDPEKLRFDFVHQKALSDEEIGRVEGLVNTCIEMKLPVYAEVAPQEKALKIFGLRAVFGEKYPPMVRVVSVGVPVGDLLKEPGNEKWKGYSVEFCGGAHLGNAWEAERFVITGEESVSKGIRRLVALTGASAREAITQGQVIESLIGQGKGMSDAALPGVIGALQKALGEANVPLLSKRRAQGAIAEFQERHKKHLKQNVGQGGGAGGAGAFDAEGLLAGAVAVNGVAVIVASVPGASTEVLRNTWDWLKKKHPQGNVVALLASEVEEVDKEGNKLPAKVNLLAGVGDPLVGKLKAGDWIKVVAPVVGGTGGGRPQLAMAGGKDVSKIEDALIAGRNFAGKRLG